MAIAAQRFKFLDKETNLPTIDFTKLSDNAVYSSVNDAVDSAIGEIKEADGLLSKVSSSLKDLQETLMNASKEVLSTLKEALNSALDAIGNLELPKVVKDIFGSLKELDLGGVKDFVKDLLHVGSVFLCNNLDFLKMFMLGFAINKNIISGLLIGLMLSWLDRYCKGFTPEEMLKSGPLSSIEKMVGPKGVLMDTANTFNNFTKGYGSFIKATTPSVPVTALDRSGFLAKVTAGDIKSSLSNLRSAEISSSDKKLYMAGIDAQLGSAEKGSTEYKNLLEARGGLATLPLISAERRDQNIQYSNLSDKLGSMAKNIQAVDLDTINTFSLSEVDKALFDKVKEFKEKSASDPDLLTRSTDSGSFADYDFKAIMPDLDDQQREHLANLKYESTDHRIHDLHPTTEVFLEGAANRVA